MCRLCYLIPLLVVTTASCGTDVDNVSNILAFLNMPPCSPDNKEFVYKDYVRGNSVPTGIFEPYEIYKWVCSYNDETLTGIKKYDSIEGVPDSPFCTATPYLTEEVIVLSDKIRVFNYLLQCDPIGEYSF